MLITWKKIKNRKINKLFKSLADPLFHYEMKIELMAKTADADSFSVIVKDLKSDRFLQGVTSFNSMPFYDPQTKMTDFSQYFEIIEKGLGHLLLGVYNELYIRKRDEKNER